MFATPAIATVGETNFETNQSDVSSCEIGVLGVDENTANAAPNFIPNQYTCLMGTYLPAGDDWTSDSSPFENDPTGYSTYQSDTTHALACAPCPANNYCPGNSGTTPWAYNQTMAQGVMPCPNEYPLSETGSGAESQCYRNCTTNDVAHSVSVIGRVYQNGRNTCEPADSNQCENGYNYVAGQTLMLPDGTSIPDDIQNVSHLEHGRSYNIDKDLTAGKWKASWTSGNNIKGTLNGIASCNTISGSWGTSVGSSDTMTNSATGIYCWCRATSWTPYGKSELPLSSVWFNLLANPSTAERCADVCAYNCAGYVYNSSGFRGRILAAVTAPTASCQPNVITLNWAGYGENNDQSQTSSCTYGETLTIPTVAPYKRGHTFTGWRVRAINEN